MLSLIGSALLAHAAASTPEVWHLGKLALSRCELTQPQSAATTAAWCADFAVPENRDEPRSRQIKLKLAIVRSEAAGVEDDPVVLLAGGPGQAATESYTAVAGALAPLRRHRHIVLLDQRGTGGSNALRCTDKETAEVLSDEQALTPQRARDETKRCLEKVQAHADPRFYTTTEAIRDLDDLRIAMGGVRFNLVGVSYGTRVAQQYARTFPAGVRSMVLDGVAPNELVFGADFARNLDDALKARFATCDKNPDCKKAFGDIYKTLYDTRERLRAAPQTVTIRDPHTWAALERHLDHDGFGGLVRLYAYSSETAALLPVGISETSRGNPAPLLGQLRLLSDNFEAGLTSGMSLSVICAEDADLLTDAPAEQRHLILGEDLIATLRAQCEVWPHGKRPDDFHTALKSDLPTLLMSGEFDPVTPARYGDAVAKGLSRSRHLVAPGQGHNVIGRGCMPKLLKRFVEKLETDALDAGCIADLGATPFFLDYNGAAP
ncbi:MAG: alpha/beta fold hydrolase [Tahibacter sp.]